MSVLRKPILTEKMTDLNKIGKYGFEVDLKANKIEIQKAVERLYGVTVKDVQTMRSIGKKKSKSTKKRASIGFTATIKKAIVTVAEGEVIDIYGEV